jgi:hypothetical protein
MKLQIGEIFLNRTKKYLLPAIKQFGSEFTENINGLQKIAIGIGDFVCNKSGLTYEKHLFILIDIKNTKGFQTRLNFFRQHDSYEDDYSFDRLIDGQFHMLIIQMPDNFYALSEFRNSKYSKMYTIEEINKLFFPIKKYEEIRKILIQDKNYRVTFAKQIAKDYNEPDFTEDQLDDDAELDYPIKSIEEIFNMHLK